jgi:hypothetical protein
MSIRNIQFFTKDNYTVDKIRSLLSNLGSLNAGRGATSILERMVLALRDEEMTQGLAEELVETAVSSSSLSDDMIQPQQASVVSAFPLAVDFCTPGGVDVGIYGNENQGTTVVIKFNRASQTLAFNMLAAWSHYHYFDEKLVVDGVEMSLASGIRQALEETR